MKTGALAAAAIALAVGVAALIRWDAQVRMVGQVPDLDADDRIAAGQSVYAAHCAACHGAHLEGQPNWRERHPNGRLPAPPHDDTGHTWHHPFEVLFAITQQGLVPPHAPEGYASDMPAFAQRLSDDEIWNVLAFIRSRWSDKVRAAHGALQRRFADQAGR